MGFKSIQEYSRCPWALRTCRVPRQKLQLLLLLSCGSTPLNGFQGKVIWQESILILIPVCVERGDRCRLQILITLHPKFFILIVIFFSCLWLWLKIILHGHVHTPWSVCLTRISFGLLLRLLLIDNNNAGGSDEDNNVLVRCQDSSYVEFKSQLSYCPCEFGQVRKTLWTFASHLLSKHGSCHLIFSAYPVPGSMLSTF